ncbi:hypothetical protein CFREI_04280 [Corynebacterium freiburgense]|nr:hypothetical protein CFREI_04280 [Corynebacterium freiburgense]
MGHGKEIHSELVVSVAEVLYQKSWGKNINSVQQARVLHELAF